MELESKTDRDDLSSEEATNLAIEGMKQYAIKDSSDQVIINLAIEITENLDDKKSKMIAIRNWILSNLRYVKDEVEAMNLYGVQHPEGVELIKSPVAVLESKKYDCDCGATLIASMLMAIGIQVRFIVVGFYPENVSGPDSYEHVFAEGYDDESGWVAIDPVSYPNEGRMLNDTRQFRIYDF